jgi:hypothetical protein
MGLLSSPLFRRRHARLLRFGGSKPSVRLGLRGRLWDRLDLRICPRRIAFWRRRSHLGSFRSTPVVDTASDLLNVKTGAYIFLQLGNRAMLRRLPPHGKRKTETNSSDRR